MADLNPKKQLTLVAFGAHPDPFDMPHQAGGTLAKYARRGHRAVLVSAAYEQEWEEEMRLLPNSWALSIDSSTLWRFSVFDVLRVLRAILLHDSLDCKCIRIPHATWREQTPSHLSPSDRCGISTALFPLRRSYSRKRTNHSHARRADSSNHFPA